jgi:ComEC/Rec2-related protein
LVLFLGSAPISNHLHQQFFADRHSHILWLPVFFALGIIFFFNFAHDDSVNLWPTLFLAASAIFLALYFKENWQFLLVIPLFIFLCGFLWAHFHSSKIAQLNPIDGQIYAMAQGKISNIKTLPQNKKRTVRYILTLDEVSLSKVRNNKKKNKKEVRQQKNRPAKFTKNSAKSHLNVNGYQQVDRKSLAVKYSAKENWLDDQYQNPPKKISVSFKRDLQGAQIGDVVEMRVMLKAFENNDSGSFDRKKFYYSQGIGAAGFAVKDLEIVNKKPQNFTKQFFDQINIWRHKISQKLMAEMGVQNGAVASALLVGIKDHIAPNINDNMRHAGLAHLMAISGLHFTLAAGIFFFVARFLLSLSANLALKYDIKKIAAILGIGACCCYLLLSGAPVAAMRAFVVMALVFLAILFDMLPNALRSCAVGAFAILLFNPAAVFSAGFALSFAAILALINLAIFTVNWRQNWQINHANQSFIGKFGIYFLGIATSSAFATLATAPFTIFYFNHYSTYGILSNLLAIPLTTFLIMPCGFLALLLMPLGLDFLPLKIMNFGLDWLLALANFTSHLPWSHFNIGTVSKMSFALTVIGGLWALLWQKKWRFLGLLPILAGIFLTFLTPKPQILTDHKAKLAGFYADDTLVILKNKPHKLASSWAKNLGLKDFVLEKDLSGGQRQKWQVKCGKVNCQFALDGKKFLILTGRNKIAEICQKDFDVLVNINKKYQTIDCKNNEK